MSVYKDKVINLLTIVLVSGITSAITAFAVVSFSQNDPAAFFPNINDVSAVPVIECGELVYSPVQSVCVDRATFDEEMQRLFSALGIDTKIYKRPNENQTE